MNAEPNVTTVPSRVSKEYCLRNIPIWVIEWYYSHNMNTEYISSMKKVASLHTKDELNVANILVDDLSKNKKSLVHSKRIAPKAQKICCVCGETVLVNSAKQFCDQYNCKGKLQLIKKVKQEAKRKPPKCKKKCIACDEKFYCVATALQKCKKCGEKLYILK